MKILQIGMGNVAGGLEAFVMNYYRVLVHMDVQFDFVCMYDKIAHEKEIKELGGKVYYLPNVKKDYRGYKKGLEKVLRETSYEAVHVNMLSAANIVPLRIAHKMGVKKVIAHSHSSSCPGLIRKTMDRYNRPKLRKYVTDYVACGELAGKWMFGETVFADGKVTIINNAINTEKFVFSSEKRRELRERSGWQEKLVIGHVGRFDIPKNHDRMIDLLQCTLEKRKNVILCLVGPKEGLYEQIKEKVQAQGLQENVYFAGKQEDIQAYLSAMDIFLFPSIFEGVPFALIEAQANGLPCLMSDSVSEEAVVFKGNVQRLSLQTDDQMWADTLLSMSKIKRTSAEKIMEQMKEAHFDIRSEAIRLKNLYLGKKEETVYEG